jgi:orotidine-5'-phosphate decarboxylase
LLVIALDPPFGPAGGLNYRDVVKATSPYAAAFKIGLPFLLEYGVDGIRALREMVEKPLIADFKLADIADVMISTLRKLASLKVTAVIAHGFVGAEGALRELVQEASRVGVEVIVVAAMTHRGSVVFMDKHFDEVVNMSLELGASGVVVPATRPWLVKRARELAGGRLKIYSPGIGPQGAEPGTAICMGADYEIVGRAITRAEDPGDAAKSIYLRLLEVSRKCRGSQ